MVLFLALACAAPEDSADRPDRPRRPRDTDTTDTGDTSGSDDTAPPDTDEPDTDEPDTGEPDTGPDDTDVPAGTGGSGGPVGEGTTAIGSSAYTWFVPECAAEAHPVAVVYTQHGSGGDGAGMVAQWRADARAGCFIVVGLDSESGVSWNFSGDVDNLARTLDAVDLAYDIGWRYLHGYSAGAHFTYVIGLANSDVFDGLGVFAGSMQYAEAWGYWPDAGARPIPVAIAHGTADTTVPYSEAEHAYAELAAAGWPVDLHAVDGGSHAYDAAAQAVAWRFWRE